MNTSSDNDFIHEIKTNFIDIDPEEVLKKARRRGLNVFTVRDFKNKENSYETIENLMQEYVDSSSTSNALTGISTGIGGYATAITLGSLDLISVSVMLFRLSQQLAILNGFDLDEALDREKAQEIYFITLGFNAATQAVLRKKLLTATSMAGKRRASQNALLKFIVITARTLGAKLSYKNAGRMIPFIGGATGAWINYAYTQSAGNQMMNAFRKEYFQPEN